MLELFVILGIASPFLLMVWLTWARRKAQARVAAAHPDPEPQARFATEDVDQDAAGNLLTRPHMADHEALEPDASGGEFGGIRALQGRRD
ncbi:MAG: hypothetical protein KDE15_09475 [Erythrobacter sp.]|nr:hypothetical protein [Erythrobacter sp.]